MPDSWLNPLDRMKVRNAYFAGLTEIKLDDGRLVTIEDVGREQVAIKVKNQLVPIALVERDRLRSKEWVGIDP